MNWTVEPGKAGSTLRIDWTEHGGPPVVAPKKKGFGQVVIKQMIEQALSGSVTIAYAPSGFRWSLLAPLSVVPGTLENSAATEGEEEE